MMLQTKIYKNIIQIGQNFLTIHTDCSLLEVLDLEKQINYLI